MMDHSGVRNSQREVSEEIQKFTDLQNDLQLKSEQFKKSLTEIDQHIEEIDI